MSPSRILRLGFLGACSVTSCTMGIRECSREHVAPLNLVLHFPRKWTFPVFCYLCLSHFYYFRPTSTMTYCPGSSRGGSGTNGDVSPPHLSQHFGPMGQYRAKKCAWLCYIG